ncbi:MAG: protein-disulfide reductase DsbD domain-containing protein, partial [Spongiibacteraceae bacterium]
MSPQPNKSGIDIKAEINPMLRRWAFMRVAVQLAWLSVALAILLSARSVVAAPLATDSAATEQVRATLIPSVRAVFPGQTVTLGVQQKIIPHWHTYWINPGDSGLATRIDWTLPTGAIAGAIQWPLPSHFDVEGITNYGYADEVTLLTDIIVPNDIPVGSNFSVQATVNWLVCAELCIPQKVELALTLPVVASAADVGPRNTDIETVRALLPQASLWPLRVEITGGEEPALSLRIVGAADALARASEIWFYADSWGRVQHNAAQPHRRDGADVVLELPPGENPPTTATELGGVLTIVEQLDGAVVRRGFVLSGVAAASSVAMARPIADISVATLPTLLPTLLLALLGGVILNLMPCVFPVLSVKALALLKYAHHTRAQIRTQGLVYTGGVLASFGLLALLLILLKAGGNQIGWGFQYQSPLFVVAVAYLLFAVGLNLSGLFSIGNAVTGVGSTLAARPGYVGSFFSGVLAAIVATPCTAPFMGAAIGYALAQPPLPLLAVFLSLGLGLALPYLLLTWWPSLQRRLPRPGPWMDRLKQLLAFPMYLAAVWLLWVLAQQAGA